MIRFACKCGKHIKVDDKYAGKKGKCPQCKEAVRIPQSDNTGLVDASIENRSEKPTNRSIPNKTTTRITSNSSAQIHTPSHENEPLENSSKIWYLHVVISLFVISALLYVFVFRDTWEIDHYSELSNLMRDASRLYQAKEKQAGIKKYDELTKLLGDRKLKRDELSESFSEVQGNYISLKNKIRAEEAEIARKLQAEKERLRQAEAEKQREEENRRLAIIEKERAEEEAEHLVFKASESGLADEQAIIKDFKLRTNYLVELSNTPEYEIRIFDVRYNLEKSNSLILPYQATLTFTGGFKKLPDNPYSYTNYKINIGYANGDWEITTVLATDLDGIWRDYHYHGFHFTNKPGFSTDEVANMAFKAFSDHVQQ